MSRHSMLSIALCDRKMVSWQELFINSPILIRSHEFDADLYIFELTEFDINLGTEWLSKHQAQIDCVKQNIILRGPKIVHRGKLRRSAVRHISVIRARKLLKRGCEGYLCNVMEIEAPKTSLNSIPMVQEFPDVFSKETSGMPPPREVKFSINLISGSTPYLRPHIGWHRWNLRS